jgi:hypothetical protein
MTLDSILNWAVPTIIILVFLGIFYTKLKTPIDQVLRWIGNLFRKGAEKVSEQQYTTKYTYG